MANYNCTYRTNYFKVTDEAAYQKLVRGLCGEDLHIFDTPDSPFHGFGGTGVLEFRSMPLLTEWLTENDPKKPVALFTEDDGNWVRVEEDDPIYKDTAYMAVSEVIELPDSYELHLVDEDDPDFTEFLYGIQKLLPDGEAMILMESGEEKLRYVTGYATVVTNKGIEYLNLTDLALKTAREMLGDPDFDTRLEY